MSSKNIQKKIFLLLLGGIALGLTISPKGQLRIFKELSRDWRKINREHLKQEIRNLYRSKLISTKQNEDGTFTLKLTERGKLKALTYRFDDMKITKKEWDGQWRIVVFDIPEEQRNARDALRIKLRGLGFHELQKSVFVFPYECKDEIDFIIEFFEVRPYVRYGILRFIDNELHLRDIFHLG
jgi:DNA-binding transcriptional regulator PaaX